MVSEGVKEKKGSKTREKEVAGGTKETNDGVLESLLRVNNNRKFFCAQAGTRHLQRLASPLL
jgi:hypothetical protein